MTPNAPTATRFVDRVVQLYGDLIFDLCESVLWSASSAQVAFRAIVREIRHADSPHRFADHERAWVLRIACEKLRKYAEKHGRRLTSSEQVMLDATLAVNSRLKEFDSYFHRLGTEDQILLLLRDKYGLPYSEISTAMGTPEGSLKLRRQQSLRTLEEWLWDQT